MATRRKRESDYAAIEETIATEQRTHLFATGRYIQRLRDNKRPSDDSDDAMSMLPEGTRCDVYNGPHGPGYIIRQERTTRDGKLEHRAIDKGPEGRSHEWIEYSEEIL